MASAVDNLPRNWEARVDSATKKTYYFNRVTRVSTWSRPRAEEEDDTLPAPWLKKIDQATGRPYYFNTKTLETTWERPGDDPLPKPWIEKVDQETRRSFYFNPDTGKVTWDRPSKNANRTPMPPGWVEQTTAEGRTFYYNTITKASTWERPPPPKLPAGWIAKLDPGSGRTYYVNTATKQSSWELPSGVGGDDESDESSDEEEQQADTKPGGRKKRQVIFAESMATDESYVPRVFPKNEGSKKLLRTVLAESFMFASLSKGDLERMVDAFQERRVPADEVVIKQGEKGDNFYVVEEGVFDIFIDKVGKVASRGPTTSFGEKALLFNCPRAATVQATGPCLIWALDRVTFRHMIANTESDNLAANRTALEMVPLLKSLSSNQFDKLASVVHVVEYKPGDIIIRKGDVGDSFYMVKSGDVVCTGIMAAGKPVADVPLGAGAYFGERALLKDMPRAANVIATSDVMCLVLGREDFSNHLGSLMEIIDRDLGLRVLASIPQLHKLSEDERSRAVRAFKTVSFPKGSILLEAGSKNASFFVVKDGNIVTSDGQKFNAGDFFGEQALSEDELVTANFIADNNVEVFMTDRQSFTDAVAGVGFEDEMEKEKAAVPQRALDVASIMKATMKPKPVIKQAELAEVALLGCGSFGRVTLVEHVPTGTAYALKRLQKVQIVSSKQEKNVMRERMLMDKCAHPFILQLMATYQDRDCLYMLLEVVLGGELFSVLANTEHGIITENATRFYASCVLSALECMHSNNILYRDLKPENMLLDSEGYIKVIDFGFAIQLKSDEDRTYTLCGTPEYMAPEVVLGKGHGRGVDYWAFGILIFEMVCGHTPFAEDSTDTMAVCQNVITQELEIPDHLSAEAASLVDALLQKEVASRLGCMKEGIQGIWAHDFFSAVDWRALMEKRLQAPWVPPLKDPFDVSHFEPEDAMKKVKKYKGNNDWCKGF